MYDLIINMKNNLIISSYSRFWKHSFDFKSKQSKKEYWVINVIHLFILLFFSVLADLLATYRFFIFASFFIDFLIIYLILSSLPFVALQIRRINMVKVKKVKDIKRQHK